MKILNILSQNLKQGSRTKSPAEDVPFPADFRGELHHNPALCTGCGTCAYVCSPGAITFEAGETSITWQYFAGQCTFCGRCVEFCPTDALTFSQNAPSIATQSMQMQTAHTVEYQPCARCGQPVMPMPEAYLSQIYGDSLPDDISARNSLCEKCRRRTTSERIKNSLLGNENSHDNQ